MFKKHSITGRIFIGVLIGLAYSLMILIISFLFDLPISNLFGAGTALTFVILGFLIGFVGIFDYHPILGFKMRWWIRGLVAGTIFGFIYVSVGYESISIMMESEFMKQFGFSSPFWAMSDFILAGLLMSFFETKIAGEGSKLPLK